MQALPGLNIVYADKDNNIFYIDNGHFPHRNPNYNWSKVVPGDTSATLWKANDYYPLDSLCQVLNPKCGYVFNNNNTPYNCTATADCPQRCSSGLCRYYFPYNDNRALRASYLFSTTGKLSYEGFKKIKYDQTFMNPAYNYAMINIESILHFDPKKYPQIKDGLAVLHKWNRSGDVNNKQAAMVALIIHDVIHRLVDEGNFPSVQCRIKEWFLVQCVKQAQDHLMHYFGKLEIPLGDFQKLVRGNVVLPIGGLPDVIAATWLSEYKDGKYKDEDGDSYIELVQYTKNGPVIESISPYGASNKEGSKHYTDQMPLFVKHQLKKESMNLDEIMKNRESIYHPL
jgi:acyl-homoserine-lactone acylase